MFRKANRLKSLLALSFIAALLVACASTAQPLDTQAPVTTDAPVLTQAPAASQALATQDPPGAASGTPTSSSASASSGNTATFVIVPDKTAAQYSIDEVFFNQNNRLNTAVGTTNAVGGQVVINYDNPPASQFGPFTVDISTLQSDEGRRDNAIRTRWLESAKFPQATFNVTQVQNFPTTWQQGQPVQFQLVGDMHVRETTHPVTWDVTATLHGDTLTGTATTQIMLADFNIPIPNIANMLKVTDGAKLTLDFTFQKQQ